MHPQGGAPQQITLPGVKHVVAVASGKGGVGKSTVAANLALALQMQGRQVGLLDADIYGPSVPIMMGVQGVDPQTTAFPLERYGISLMSMGFLVSPSRRSSGAARWWTATSANSSWPCPGATSITW